MIFEHNKSICISRFSYPVYTLPSEEDVEDFAAMMSDAGFHYFLVDWPKNEPGKQDMDK